MRFTAKEMHIHLVEVMGYTEAERYYVRKFNSDTGTYLGSRRIMKDDYRHTHWYDTKDRRVDTQPINYMVD